MQVQILSRVLRVQHGKAREIKEIQTCRIPLYFFIGSTHSNKWRKLHIMGDGLHRIFVNDLTTKDGKKPAVVIGKYLCIAHSNQVLDKDTYQIYSIVTNRPVLPTRINDWDYAVEIANKINETYGEYLEIYEACPDWNVLEIARLSVPNGETLWNQLSNFPDEIGLENS